MAKYEIKHTCGHVKTYQIAGRYDERPKKVARLESEECPDCRRARENAEAAAKAENAGRPELTGSEKQVAWANTIRERCAARINDPKQKSDVVDEVLSIIEKRLRLENKGNEYVMEMGKTIAAKLGENASDAIIAMLNDAVNEVTDAKQWIDNRLMFLCFVADAVAVKLIGSDVDKKPVVLKDDQFGRCKNGSFFVRTVGWVESTDQRINTALAFVMAEDVTENEDGTISVPEDVLDAALAQAGRKTQEEKICGYVDIHVKKSSK